MLGVIQVLFKIVVYQLEYWSLMVYRLGYLEIVFDEGIVSFEVMVYFEGVLYLMFYLLMQVYEDLFLQILVLKVYFSFKFFVRLVESYFQLYFRLVFFFV